MCLYLNSRSKVRKAERAITVYKAVNLITRTGTAISSFQGAEYRRGELKRVPYFNRGSRKFTATIPLDTTSIYQGLHFYTSLRAAKRQGSIVIECVVPRGTLYIIGTSGEGVSLAIRPKKAVDAKPFNKARADYYKAKADYHKAYADYNKAEADYNKAEADYDKAYADYNKAYADLDKAEADYHRAVFNKRR